jgi:hypothetical protein
VFDLQGHLSPGQLEDRFGQRRGGCAAEDGDEVRRLLRDANRVAEGVRRTESRDPVCSADSTGVTGSFVP